MAQRAGQAMRGEKLLRLRAVLQVGGEVLGSFCRFFQNFFGIFCNFFGKFLQFFGKFPQNFCNFFQPLRFPYDFSENSCPQSVTVQPGSRHYCKFTIKFTPKFTLILIKILQSTKFEGSHFHNSLSTFTSINGFSQPSQTF